jgi:hypothetical protein
MADKITRLLIPGTLKLYTEVKEVTLKTNGAIIVVKSLYCDDVT